MLSFELNFYQWSDLQLIFMPWLVPSKNGGKKSQACYEEHDNSSLYDNLTFS